MRQLVTILCVFFCINTFAANRGMVVSENKIASEVGANILRQGGNAIDAAVAVGYALAVVNPCCGNIGGGGFMTIHLANGNNIFLNFREKAPLKANKNMFLDAEQNVIPNQSTIGYLAVGVPGTVLGLDTALQRYGTMTRKQVMAPAIRIAEKGYIVTPFEAAKIKQYAPAFRTQPNIMAIYFKHDEPIQAGEVLTQPNLATTLRAIANQGPAVFYQGYIANAIVTASSAHGGLLSMRDFATYHIETLKPITCTYRGYTIISAPPPSSGGITLCEMLNILENFSLNQLGYHTVESTRIITDAMHIGFTDRNNKLGDPDFVQNPTKTLLSKKYAATMSELIKQHKTLHNQNTHTQHELTDTTHYSVFDQKGNAVSLTYTINGMFGALVIAGNTGFFLNNEMDDFSAKPGAVNQFNLVENTNNSIQPSKRPLSSMTPTIVMKDGKVVMVVGSPGGPRIITTVLQTLLNVIDYGMTIQAATDAPRFHHQAVPETIYLEPNALSPDVIHQLEQQHYHFTPQATWSAMEAIQIDPLHHTINGANDMRRPDGGAVGF
jgi:gamma-glutamyltranspeptidase/glutathione hydrolase